MSGVAAALRLLIPCDKEFKATSVTVTDTATKFTSELTGGYKRKLFSAYNNSDTVSGELYYGHDNTVTASNGRVIPKGADIELILTTDLDVYFVAETGENGDLRVFEGA